MGTARAVNYRECSMVKTAYIDPVQGQVVHAAC